MSNESSNSNNIGGYYINHNNSVYFVDENGTMNPRNLILDGRNSETEARNQNGYSDSNNSCLLIKPTHFRPEQISGNLMSNTGSNTNSTFTELQPAANVFNQISNLETKNLVYR